MIRHVTFGYIISWWALVSHCAQDRLSWNFTGVNHSASGRFIMNHESHWRCWTIDSSCAR